VYFGGCARGAQIDKRAITAKPALRMGTGAAAGDIGERDLAGERGTSGSARSRAARKAAAEAKRVAEAQDFAPAGRPSDVFGADLPLKTPGAPPGGPRRRDMFTLLVLHLISNSESGASYGNQLIERIERITDGAVSLNPNTMYPLLRELEGGGLIEGRWEHPEKRSRRLYTVTDRGREEYARLRDGIAPFLDSIIKTISLIKQEIYKKG
jgi:PadR family transcriptional regulator, regulatory protein PadR